MIPKSQLETWSNPGADDSAMKTQNRVRNVLKSDDSVPVEKDKDFDVFLQGSYKNSTNIYADTKIRLARLATTGSSSMKMLLKLSKITIRAGRFL